MNLHKQGLLAAAKAARKWDKQKHGLCCLNYFHFGYDVEDLDVESTYTGPIEHC